MLGEHNLSSSSTPSKVNCLVIRTLHFRGVRGDLQERPLSVFPMPILGFPMPLSQSSEHKKPDFVLEMPEIEGSEGLGAHGLCGRVANSAGNGCRLAGGRCSDTEQ